jgi:hypothetical protein
MPPPKTFTGCWTCRSRRLKCDETKPECIQYQLKGISCGGYHTSLQWMRPTSICGCLDNDAPASPRQMHRRAFWPRYPIKGQASTTNKARIINTSWHHIPMLTQWLLLNRMNLGLGLCL